MHDIPYTYTERVMHIPNIAVVGNEYGLQKAQKSPLNSRIKEYRMKFMVRIIDFRYSFVTYCIRHGPPVVLSSFLI